MQPVLGGLSIRLMVLFVLILLYHAAVWPNQLANKMIAEVTKFKAIANIKLHLNSFI